MRAADLAFRNATLAHRLDEIVDRARRNALDIGFLNDGGQRFSAIRRGSRKPRK
jgi:hypothetical protein